MNDLRVPDTSNILLEISLVNSLSIYTQVSALLSLEPLEAIFHLEIALCIFKDTILLTLIKNMGKLAFFLLSLNAF